MKLLRARTTAIGIDTGSRFIKALQAERDGEGVRIVAAARLPRAEQGAKLAASELARLAAVLERQGFRGRKVVMAMHAAAETASPIQLPPRASGAPLEEIALAQVADAARCAPGELETRWWETVAGRRPGEGVAAFGVGVRRDELAAALDDFASAGFDVAAVDARACALARGCAACHGAQIEAGAWALVEIGASASFVTVVHHGVVFFVRTLPEAGLDAVVEAVASESGADRALVEAAIQRFNHPSAAERNSLQAQTDARVRAMLDLLAHEVQASVSYALQTIGGANEVRVLVAGAGGGIPGVAPCLAERMQAAVAVAAVSGLPPAADAGAASALVCALGLALHAAEDAPW